VERRTRWVKEGAIVRERNRKTRLCGRKQRREFTGKVKRRTRATSLGLEEESQLGCGEPVQTAFWFISRPECAHVTFPTRTYNASARAN